MKLKSIVHIQKNLDSRFYQYPEWWQNHYFVELDIEIPLDEQGNKAFSLVQKKNNVFRLAQFVHVTPSNDVCFMADWKWRENVGIEILTPIRNQIQWLEYLLVMLENLVKKTNENKVRISNFQFVDFSQFYFL